MNIVVYVLLRGGLYPSTYVGSFDSAEGAQAAREVLRMEYPDQRFAIIVDEVQP